MTGGSGFIGTNLVAALLESGNEVRALDRTQPRDPSHAAVFREVELTDRARLAAAVAEFRPQLVFHLGARTDLDGDTLADYAANTDGTANLIAALQGAPGLERVIFASSMLVCRNGYRPRDEFDYCPSTVYGESKVEMEKIVRAAALDVPWALVRPTSIWGPWFGVPYNDFFRAVIAGRYVHPKGRRVMQSFGYVGNAVHELLAFAGADAAAIDGKTFFVSDYPAIEFGGWADAIARLAGAKPVRRVPFALLKTIAIAGDLLQAVTRRPMPLTSFRLQNLVTENEQDLSATQAIAGELPYSVDQGIELTLAWMRDAGLID